MPSIDDAQAAAYKLADPSTPYNPASAIAKEWLRLKKEGYLIGVPIGPEIDVGNGQRAQSFTSGAVLVWRGGDKVELV